MGFQNYKRMGCYKKEKTERPKEEKRNLPKKKMKRLKTIGIMLYEKE